MMNTGKQIALVYLPTLQQFTEKFIQNLKDEKPKPESYHSNGLADSQNGKSSVNDQLQGKDLKLPVRTVTIRRRLRDVFLARSLHEVPLLKKRMC